MGLIRRSKSPSDAGDRGPTRVKPEVITAHVHDTCRGPLGDQESPDQRGFSSADGGWATLLV